MSTMMRSEEGPESRISLSVRILISSSWISTFGSVSVVNKFYNYRTTVDCTGLDVMRLAKASFSRLKLSK